MSVKFGEDLYSSQMCYSLFINKWYYNKVSDKKKGITFMEVEDLVFNVIEQNPERFDKLLQKLGYQKTTMCKENLTTREMCEQLGINYSSWRQSEVRNHPEIVRLRDTTISRNHIYKSSSLSIIERVWKNRKR